MVVTLVWLFLVLCLLWSVGSLSSLTEKVGANPLGMYFPVTKYFGGGISWVLGYVCAYIFPDGPCSLHMNSVWELQLFPLCMSYKIPSICQNWWQRFVSWGQKDDSAICVGDCSSGWPWFDSHHSHAGLQCLTQVVGHLVLFSGLCQHWSHMLSRYACRQNTYTHKRREEKQKERA